MSIPTVSTVHLIKGLGRVNKAVKIKNRQGNQSNEEEDPSAEKFQLALLSQLHLSYSKLWRMSSMGVRISETNVRPFAMLLGELKVTNVGDLQSIACADVLII